jgi:ActR/RegA family two-component response regulator
MSKKCYSVLVVDDRDNWRELLTEILDDQFEVKSAKDYESAVAAIQDRNPPFHVVVTDMRLVDEQEHNEDGLRLIEYLNKRGDETKTIVVTGYATIGSTTRALTKLKAYYYLEKNPSDETSFNPDKFKELVFDAAENTIRHDVFVVMPFEKGFEAAYDRIKKIANSVGLKKCLRADELSTPSNTIHIMDQVLHDIRHARIVLADLSDGNPNVHFEVGIAKALRKKLVLLSQEEDDQIVSMLQGNKVIFYKDSIDGVGQLELQLSSVLRQLKDQNVSDDNESYPSDESMGCISVTPNNVSGKDTHKSIIKMAMEQEEIACFYAWDIVSSDNQPKEIETMMRKSNLIIVDLAGKDPDAFYLAGFAHGLKKKRIFLLPEGMPEPFDIRTISLVKYSKKLQEMREKAVRELVAMTKKVLDKTDEFGNDERIDILFLSAEPTDQVRLRLGQEFREIREELSKARERDRITLELPEFSLRPKDITEAMLNTDAQVIHFSGHGGTGGQLYFETEKGDSLPVEPEILAELFKEFSGKIKCVVLNACYSEKQAKAIVRYIDYVVGMSQEISDSAATAFSIGFYQALGAGRNIEKAFALGKIQSGMQNGPEYDTPVLLKRRQ